MSATAIMLKAIQHVLDRRQTDPDLGYQINPLTESFHLLCEAEAAALGLSLEEVMGLRRRDLQPDYSRRRVYVLALEDEVRRLGGHPSDVSLAPPRIPKPRAKTRGAP